MAAAGQEFTEFAAGASPRLRRGCGAAAARGRGARPITISGEALGMTVVGS